MVRVSRRFQLERHEIHLDGTTTKASHDIEIQCYMVEEIRPTQTEGSVWNNDWEEEHTLRHPLTRELVLEKLSKDDEIKRLKAIISEMEHENSEKRQTTPQPTDTGMIIFLFENVWQRLFFSRFFYS